MAKIGRNERCPCGSGRKYKHCCAKKPQGGVRPATADEQLKVSLVNAVAESVANAGRQEQVISELGVFVLLSTKTGDSWLFEVTQSDCVQLAANGEPLPVPIDENPETIEIEWSHIYRVRDRKMVLTAYADKSETVLEDCPVKELAASIKRIRKRIPKGMLSEIHIG